ncbi:hypothetical protein V1264_014960 [Littorina saxatilis]|uniref:HYR domain-containing protein n=1 Tax=Littorina saxatilis TaxID=31220 RepID=A0AAN9BK53_9CAEN
MFADPYFLNCPEEMVVIDVSENSDEAQVNFDLQAKDCKGDKLDVYMADNYLYAGVGEENFQMTSATTARDGKGNFAECVFHVRVRDIYPPEFLTCPSDFTEPAPGPVTWEIPVARDNVGLAIPPTSRRHPGDKMAAGEYMIEYWAEDYQGNIARCSFVVTVAGFHEALTPSRHIGGNVAGGDGVHHPSHEHPQPLPHSHASISIGIGISTTLLVVVLIALALLFYRRQRNQRNASASGASVTRETGMGWNNGGRSHCPPQYSLPPDDIMSPPMYSRSNEMMGTASGGMQEAEELPSKSPFS